MRTREVSWSSFLREPSSVEPLLERGDVLLRRRDGETLRLSRESSEAALRDALSVTGRLVAGAGKLDASALAERVPWTRFLSAKDRQLFLRELLSCLEASADLGDFTALGRLVAEWKTTAGLHAEGLADRLQGRIEIDADAGTVRRP